MGAEITQHDLKMCMELQDTRKVFTVNKSKRVFDGKKKLSATSRKYLRDNACGFSDTLVKYADNDASWTNFLPGVRMNDEDYFYYSGVYRIMPESTRDKLRTEKFSKKNMPEVEASRPFIMSCMNISWNIYCGDGETIANKGIPEDIRMLMLDAASEGCDWLSIEM